MAGSGAQSHQSLDTFIANERRARQRLREAKLSGAEVNVGDELRGEWRSVRSAMLKAYAAPANWHRGKPRHFIPQDVALILADEDACRFAAEADYSRELALARAEFDRDQERRGTRELGKYLVLNATYKYVVAVAPHRQGQLLPLSLLQTSLADGMRPRSQKGGPNQIPLQHLLLRQHAAAAVAILLDDKKNFQPPGKRKDAAENHVARILRKLKVVNIDGKTVDGKTVGNWRKAVAVHAVGFGLPGKPDKTQPDPERCDYRVQAFANVWLTWRELKAKGVSATWFVDRLLDEKLRALSER